MDGIGGIGDLVVCCGILWEYRMGILEWVWDMGLGIDIWVLVFLSNRGICLVIMPVHAWTQANDNLNAGLLGY